ncbi:hypothetical protein KSP40_PGU016845 [Platanthera guangdongensis]|uniref:Uncharacterized protein n=1 Tax=Platanthera guangdongensis TaxID=2320717 RepID=A0ABR2MP53_9ASPA
MREGPKHCNSFLQAANPHRGRAGKVRFENQLLGLCRTFPPYVLWTDWQTENRGLCCCFDDEKAQPLGPVVAVAETMLASE